MKSAVMVPTVLEGEIGGIITVLPATPENIQFEISGTGCHSGIKGEAGNGGGGWYFSPPEPNKYCRGKGGRSRVRTITEDLADIVLRSLEGDTATHEGEGGCLIMVDEEKYGNNSASEKKRMLSGPDL